MTTYEQAVEQWERRTRAWKLSAWAYVGTIVVSLAGFLVSRHLRPEWPMWPWVVAPCIAGAVCSWLGARMDEAKEIRRAAAQLKAERVAEELGATAARRQLVRWLEALERYPTLSVEQKRIVQEVAQRVEASEDVAFTAAALQRAAERTHGRGAN